MNAKERLQNEYDELVERNSKLRDFLSSENFDEIITNAEQENLLLVQQCQQQALILTLRRRLEIWEDTDNG